MKFFITCAVIVFIAAVVIAAGFVGDAAESEIAIDSAAAVNQALAAESQAIVQPDAPAAAGEVAVANTVDAVAAVEAQIEPADVPFDTLPVYDALLALNFSADDSLLLDRNTLAALQAMEAALGPDADADAVAQLRQLLEEALPAGIALQLMELTSQYSAYRRAELDVRAALSPHTADPMQGYDQLVALRRTYLGEEAAGKLFAEEEAQLPYMTSAFAVARDENLTQEARRARLSELQAAFNDTASRMDSPLAKQVLAARVARMRAGGASEEEIFALRNRLLGSAEAQRLAEADQATGVAR
ncbi:hypothetical protein M0G74_15045 [Microbulbifer sp. CAU 1566]|uniref:lipase secretion chaperone n=1 Tax=Microbulbifer sp. CAU 1566 TaxID=2933269 RepID=UPI0020052C92|nr:hypothetical protein [Microbulbifer sp. CAU 1566]